MERAFFICRQKICLKAFFIRVEFQYGYSAKKIFLCPLVFIGWQFKMSRVKSSEIAILVKNWVKSTSHVLEIVSQFLKIAGGI